MRFALNSTPRKSTRLAHAVRTTVEALEGRRMLTVLNSGEIGVFQGTGGQAVRVELTGPGTFAFVGARQNEVSGLQQLNDIPMTIFNQAGVVIRTNLGGFGGRDGIRVIPKVTGFDDGLFGSGQTVLEDNAPFDPFYSNAPSGSINIGGLGTNVKGRTYGVNRIPLGPTASRIATGWPG